MTNLELQGSRSVLWCTVRTPTNFESLCCSNCGCEAREESSSCGEGMGLCSGCGSFAFCGPECQRQSWKRHKRDCKSIRKFDDELRKCVTIVTKTLLKDSNDKEDNELFPQDCMDVEGKKCFGRLWQINEESRAYLRCRADLAVKLKNSSHLGKNNRCVTRSLEMALEHIMDILWLNRGDDLGVRDIVPGIMIRLGRLQEAYDFIKWWLTTNTQKYDWDDLTLPYMSMQNENMKEDVKWIELDNEMYVPLSLMFDLSLIKILMVLEMEQLESKDNTDLELRVQAIQVLRKVHKLNKYLLPSLPEPQRLLSLQFRGLSLGGEEEASLVMQSSYPLWASTEGAITFIKCNLNEINQK